MARPSSGERGNNAGRPAIDLTPAASLTATCKHILNGSVEDLRGVLRDVSFVRVTTMKEGGMDYHSQSKIVSHFEHVFLTQLDHELAHDAGKYNAALIRYATLALSIHPFSVLSMLYRSACVLTRYASRRTCSDDRSSSNRDACDDSLMLALAATLAHKASLLDGNLRRMPHFPEAARCFFRTLLSHDSEGQPPAGRIESALRSRRFCAALCRCARAGLVTGALKTVSLLCAIADVAVAYIFDPTTCERDMMCEVGSSTRASAQADGARNINNTDNAEADNRASRLEMKRLEYEIFDTLHFLSTFTSWTLHNAATTFGVVSAHFGDVRHGVKEPCLRDGKSRAILISRNVDIKPLPIKLRSQA